MFPVVPDCPDSDQISNSTVAKLLEVDSELAGDEAELLSQLQSIQSKRRSLKSVISLFASTDTTDVAPVEKPEQTLPATLKPPVRSVNENLTTPPLETSRASTTAESQTEAVPAPGFKVAEKTAPPPTQENQVKKTTKLAPTAQASQSRSGWQPYMQQEFRNTSLPSAVYAVLQRQEQQVFDIPAVMKAIFMDELPKEMETKARRQVTNILSSGALKNKWYRGQPGYYSMSRALAKANSA